MRDSAKLYYGEAARRQAKEKGNEVLLLSMEQVKGQSPEEMSEAWKQLFCDYAPGRLRNYCGSAGRMRRCRPAAPGFYIGCFRSCCRG